MLNKIIVERFKNIGRVEIDLSSITTLIGSNNSGKSSILQAIQFAVSISQTAKTQATGWVSDREKLSTTMGQDELIYSPLKDAFALAPQGRLRTEESHSIQVTFVEKDKTAVVAARKGKNKNIAATINGRDLGSTLQDIDSPYSIIVPGLAGIPASEEHKSPSIVRKAAAKGDANSVFRNILFLLHNDTTAWNRLVSYLAEIFPEISIQLAFDENRDEHIGVTVKVGGATLPIDSCGTGVLQAIQILAYAFLYKPRLLILDEPDSHLHPNNQRVLAKVLRKVATELGIQVLLSTHSKYLVQELKDSSEFVWIRNGKREAHSPDYLLESLLEIGALGAGEDLESFDALVLTEDEDSDLIRVVLEANGFNLSRTQVLAYKGCSNQDTANALIEYALAKNPSLSVVVHRDRDYFTPEEEQKYRTSFAGQIQVFLTPGNDIESLFSSRAHLGHVYQLTDQQLDDLENKAKTEKWDEILRKIVNSLVDRKRKQGGSIDSGTIAVDVLAMLNGNFAVYRHGKTYLKGVHTVLQRDFSKVVGTYVSSPALIVPELRDVATRLWGS